jgi:hypothetical protein
MAHGTRHYSKIHYFSFFAVSPSAHALLALALTAWLSAWLLWAVFSSPHNERPFPFQAPSSLNSNIYFSFLDSRFRFYFSPETFSGSFVNRSSERQISRVSSSQLTSPVEPNNTATTLETSRFAQRPVSQSLPAPRRVSQSTPLGGSNQSDETPTAPIRDNTAIFEEFFAKLFGKFSPSTVRLAYALADDSQLGGADLMTSRYDQWTAIYDISAHTVYMPDGTRLEAHSGFGASLDDPAAVSEKNRGPTPPNVYNLELREQPFHGVRALRLIPVDNQKALGRTGLLAHSFMLGPNGDSNGCLSVKDYDAFLHAYASHQIKRLVVVARLD